MHTTSASLLQRLRSPDTAAAWGRFVDLYTPLLYFWAKRAGLAEADAADVVQDVFVALLGRLPAFDYQPGRSFRNWLWVIVQNKIRERFRREQARAGVPLSELPGPAQDDPAAALADSDYQAHLLRQALAVMQRDFEPTTWRACWEHVVRDRPAAEVAAELGISLNAVYIAKSRVLRRLRAELDGLLD